MKENFEITATDGKKYWISRSHAVVSCIVGVDEYYNLYFLLERRGPGCPDNVGKLAFPCGYVNWDETRADAVFRETFEETGLELDKEKLIEWETVDDPKADTRQNIVTRYISLIQLEELQKKMPELLEKIATSEERGGEAKEVSELLLLSFDEVMDVSEEEFAFGHQEVIEDLYTFLDEEYMDEFLY